MGEATWPVGEGNRVGMWSAIKRLPAQPPDLIIGLFHFEVGGVSESEPLSLVLLKAKCHSLPAEAPADFDCETGIVADLSARLGAASGSLS